MSASQRVFLHIIISYSAIWFTVWIDLTLVWKSTKCFPELFVFATAFHKSRDLFISPYWRDLDSYTRQGSSFYDFSSYRAHPGNFSMICSRLPCCFSDPNAENDHCLIESAWQILFLSVSIVVMFQSFNEMSFSSGMLGWQKGKLSYVSDQYAFQCGKYS